MAEQLASLRQKGGSLSETVLWTNPNTANPFNGQEVTLSDDMDNYKYIAVEYAYSTAALDNISKCIYSVEDFKKGTYGDSTRRDNMVLGITNASETIYGRVVNYITNTKIQFRGCYGINTTVTANSNAIPTQIIGLK